MKRPKRMQRTSVWLCTWLALAPAALAGGDPDEPIPSAYGLAEPSTEATAQPSPPSEPVFEATPAEEPRPTVSAEPVAAKFTPADPKLRLPKGDSAFEYFDLLIQLDDGGIVLGRFLVTNVGPGVRTAVALGHTLVPGGARKMFRNARRNGSWELSSDRLNMSINKSHLELRGGEARLRITKNSSQIDLRFPLDARRPIPASVMPPKMSSDLLAANAPVRGSIVVAGVLSSQSASGRASLTHSWSKKAEESRLQRRIDVFALRDGPSLQLVDIETAKGRKSTWLQLRDEKNVIFDTVEISLRPEGRLAGSSDGYPLPARLVVEGEGVSGAIELQTLLHSQDPLGEIPQPARSIIRWSVDSQPHQAWATARFAVTLRRGFDAPPVSLQGEALTAVGYLNPSP